MQKIGRPTQNNYTFKPDYIDTLGREYSNLTDSELKMYEDTTTTSMPMNMRLPRTTPVENRLPPPDIGRQITLAHPGTKKMIGRGKIAEVWLGARSNCGLVFFDDLVLLADESVERCDDKEKHADE